MIATAIFTRGLRATLMAATIACLVTAPVPPAFAVSGGDGLNDANTITPIKHVILIVGENHSFDNAFATYIPKPGNTILNLLSEGIINADGTPGPNFARASQYSATQNGTFNLSQTNKTLYNSATMPMIKTGDANPVASDSTGAPFATIQYAQLYNPAIPANALKLLTTGATGVNTQNGGDSIDTRFANAASPANGPFPLTYPRVSYDAYTGDPVHRFYHMWQQADCSVATATPANPSGCLNDLFAWVQGATWSTVGNPRPGTDDSMGFMNMAKGDEPYFKSLADTYAISDNYHQPIMGGSGPNAVAIGTGTAIFYSDGQGNVATPPANQIANPNPQPGTNDWYQIDDAYVNCSDPTVPGVTEIDAYLNLLPYRTPQVCHPGAYYMLNNKGPGYNGDGTVNTSSGNLPPSNVPTIGDVLNGYHVSWRYYGEGWDNFAANQNLVYCNICNPFGYETSIMADATQRTTHNADIPAFEADVASGNLPAVSIIKPGALLDGHPASSKMDLFEAFTRRIIGDVQANPAVWAGTAIIVTVDEGGGYYDTGYIQPVDFFGDGTRIPVIVVSPLAKSGYVSHSYTDHVSFLKFVEANWSLPKIAGNSRDNLPNPTATKSNPYVPTNSPAIGDLMDMFSFSGN